MVQSTGKTSAAVVGAFQNGLISSAQPSTANKWKDLGEQHIVRATSVYTNIPLTQGKKLSAVVKKAQDKTLGTVAQSTAIANIAKTPLR